MALTKGTVVSGNAHIPYPTVAGALVAATFSHTFLKAMPAGDGVEIACLPQGCKLVDVIAVFDDMDGNATLEFDLGLITGEFGSEDPARVIGNEILAAVTTGQTGGVARPTKASAFRVPVSSKDRGIGLKVKTAAGAFAAGTVNVTLLYNCP